jgi:hypothetical protein
MSHEDCFNQAYINDLSANKKNDDIILNYLAKFVAKTNVGFMIRLSKQHQWVPLTKIQLKMMLCSSNKRVNLFIEKYGHNNIPVDINPADGDYLDSNGYHLKVNLWNGFAVKPFDQSVPFDTLTRVISPWLNHIKICWCQNDESLFKDIINHFAHIVQRPHIRTKKIVIFRSPSDELVDCVFEPIKKILFPWNYANLEGKGNIILSNNDNFEWSQSLILVIKEPIPRPDIIKNLLRSDEMHIRCKGHRGFVVSNFINIFINSMTFSVSSYDANTVLNVDSNTSLNTLEVSSIDPQYLLSFLIRVDLQ